MDPNSNYVQNGELINKQKTFYFKFITCNGYVPDQRPSQPLNPVDSLWLSLERGLPVIGIPSREAYRSIFKFRSTYIWLINYLMRCSTPRGERIGLDCLHRFDEPKLSFVISIRQHTLSSTTKFPSPKVKKMCYLYRCRSYHHQLRAERIGSETGPRNPNYCLLFSASETDHRWTLCG